jgi:ketosteroid isomerase-like protein
MIQAVEDVIKRAIETGDVGALDACFADDMEFEVALALGTAAPGRCASEPLRQLERIDLPHGDSAPEFFVDGERIVAFWDERVSLRTGVAIRSQSTLVFDVRDGLITRLAIHHDLAPASAGRPERTLRSAPAPVARDKRRERARAPGAC